jgi:putative membrane protein
MSKDPRTDRGHAIAESEAISMPALVARGAVGGVLMGLANLVPGISGGTMLLAAGVYPTFIAAIAAVTTLRFSTRSFVALAAIGGSAVLAILLLAGTMRDLVVEQRWAMYSIFIGLTLGGVPLVWRLARPATPAVWIAAAAGFAVMAVMAFGGGIAATGGTSSLLLALAGLAGASAMILPGVSGGYLLLLLGQYEVILGAIDTLKLGLLGNDGTGFDMAIVLESMRVVVPVGIGVVIGIVAVSNLLKWLLERYEKATLGVLLGLLLGAVVGLFPFQAPVRPEAGHVHRGVVLDATEAAALDEEYWPLERFTPTGAQVGGAVALLLAGFAGTLLIDRIGRTKDA